MIIKALIENTTDNPALETEHGLSLYIEANGHKILFDAGQTGAFADNAAKLGVDLSAVDLAVLSHAHYDHSGGLPAFISINHTAPIYVSQYAFDECLHDEDRYIGVDPSLRGNPRLSYVKDSFQLGQGLTLFSGEGREYHQPLTPNGLNVRRDCKVIPDDFRHEQYLLITEGTKRVLVSGCSHKGVVNIVDWFKPDVLVGGLHLMWLDPHGDGQAALDETAKELIHYPTVYYGSHCTGTAQYEYLKPQMKDRLFYLSTGQEITH